MLKRSYDQVRFFPGVQGWFDIANQCDTQQ